MLQQMQAKAHQAILDSLPQKPGLGGIRVDVSSGDLAAETWIGAPEEDGFLNLLRRNGSLRWAAPAAPIAIDPQTGEPGFRLVVPLSIWSNQLELEKYMAHRWHPAIEVQGYSKLRLLRNIPESANRFWYGRSQRLCLMLDRRPALIAAAVFPGALLELRACTSQRRLRRIARILLARSGASHNPCSFNLLEDKSIAGLLRAVEIRNDTPLQQLRALEKQLLQQAEDDRKLLLVLTDPDLPLDELVQGMGTEPIKEVQ